MEQRSSSSNYVTRQLQIVFAISILILLISSYASFYTNNNLIQSSQMVNHSNEVILAMENLIASVKDAEAGQRGYVITHNPEFLEPYKGVHQKSLTIFEHLQKLTADNPVQQQYLSKAKVILDERFEQMGKVLEIAGQSANDTLFSMSEEEMRRGKVLMDELRAVVEKIKGEEKRLLSIHEAKQQSFIRYTPFFVIAAAFISILISVLAYVRIKKDLEERIKKQKEDEALYRETSGRISRMEIITQKIASGDYMARSIAEKDDELGRISAALNAMAEALGQNFNELQRNAWLQTGSLRLSDSMRGERFTHSLGNKIVASVAEYADARVGTFYLADKNAHLKLAGSYAAKNPPETIAPRQGLAGQAVAEKTMKIVSELPPHYLSISSSVGEVAPAHLLIVPLLYNDEVLAVLELGFLKKPGETTMALLKNNSEAMAVALNAAINYEKMQELLEETQAQAEELQAQHNELENLNTELEAQTQKLQASEEELRVQQEELLQSNQELEERSRLLEERNQTIAERTLEIQKKAEELEQTTKYKSEFLANMSHELRTPLNSILLLSRLLSENQPQNLTSDQIEYAQVIQSSGTGLLSLIDEILDLSKIEAGKMELEYTSVKPTDIAAEMQRLFMPVAQEKKISFTVSIAEDLPAGIETDRLRLEQIIKNLLSNAIKFTSKGGVDLQIKPEGKSKIAFSVKDTGIGISKEKQQLIFEAFQQADGSTRRKFGGTGLGLSISRQLAKLLGGDISLTSEPEKGSLFTLTIPSEKNHSFSEKTENAQTSEFEKISREEVPASRYLSLSIPESIPDDRDAIESTDKAVLIVEDDTAFAKALLDFTRSKDYKGIVAVRGDEAIDLARQYMPAGILLDIQLPVKNGWEVMEELKNDPHTRHIPVHVMSSHRVKRESLMKGAIDFISKPVTFDRMKDVFGKIEYVLNKENKKVLIIEENPKHAKALAYFLGTYNVNAEISGTVGDSISALNKEHVDCVILDMGIPDAAAYDALEKIKENPGLENLPIIVFTGKSLSKTEEEKLRQYADTIVVKTAHSYKRILDEVSLFLHLMETQRREDRRKSGGKLGTLTEVLRHKTILITDDDVRNIFSLTKALETHKMNVLSATDGKEALKVLQQNPDTAVVLMDIMMPKMDGYETMKHIRSQAKYKNLPIIAVTAKAMVGDREKCIRAGASDYISKPVDIDQLLSLLRVWLYDKS